MKGRKLYLTTSLVLLLTGQLLFAQTTQKVYLSGTGADNTVDWQFFCTDGYKSGEWTTIPVPSNWELHGFGKYNYGHAKDEERGKESGIYKHSFNVPSDWEGKQVEIIFDGSMTDTEVKINGQLAGAIHQGAFYRFKYDISSLLKYDKQNLLEVKVDKHSANTSVNKAERYADFWIFGGIFRPVWLEAFPQEHLERVAIDAKADGSIKIDAFVANLKDPATIVAQVKTHDGKRFGKPIEKTFQPG